jgi:cytoskeletal protein RodZ
MDPQNQLSNKPPEQIFGAYLRDQRLFRGISLEEIALSSKIPLYRLQALEEGRWDLFPAPVYLLGAIRSYAKTLGMIEEDLILHLKEVAPGILMRKPSYLRPLQKNRKWFFLGALLLGGILFVFLLLWKVR